jgi:hypothetical protein
MLLTRRLIATTVRDPALPRQTSVTRGQAPRPSGQLLRAICCRAGSPIGLDSTQSRVRARERAAHVEKKFFPCIERAINDAVCCN